jgi:hypothetical protein
MELDSDYIDELAGTDNLPPVTVTRDMVLVDGFHRLEAAKRRGDEKIQVTIQDVTEDEAMAMAGKLNISLGKRLTVLELARRVSFMVKKQPQNPAGFKLLPSGLLTPSKELSDVSYLVFDVVNAWWLIEAATLAYSEEDFARERFVKPACRRSRSSAAHAPNATLRATTGS